MLDLHDGGDYFIINGTYTTEKSTVAANHQKIDKEILDARLFSNITDLLLTSTVKFLKNKQLNSTSDLVITAVTPLDEAKTLASSTVRNILDNAISNIDIAMFYRYTKANNILNDANMTVTSSNSTARSTEINSITVLATKTMLQAALTELTVTSTAIETCRIIFDDALLAIQGIQDAIDVPGVNLALSTFTTKHK